MSKKDSKNENKESKIIVIVAIIGLLGTIVTAILSSPALITWIEKTPEPTKTIEVATQRPVSIFQDTFDDNNKKWDTDSYEFSGYSVDINIESGKLYRIMEANETSNGNFGAIEIPEIDKDDFCLKFDARFIESSKDTAIVIILRAKDYDDSEKRSYYYVRLYQDGKGVIRLNPPGNDNTLQIRELDKLISWNNTTHTITISLQGNDFEIYDNGGLLLQTSFTGDEILSGTGTIRLGSEIFIPNEKVIIEFDNVSVYSQCP